MDMGAEREKFLRMLDFIDMVKDFNISEYVDFISDLCLATLFFNLDVPFKVIWDKIKAAGIDIISYELESYYISGGNLAMKYLIRSTTYGKFYFVILSSEIDETLQKISKGKCKVVNIEKVLNESIIVCGGAA